MVAAHGPHVLSRRTFLASATALSLVRAGQPEARGLHIYGGDFFATPRSQWDAETLAEEPSDGARIRAVFERENERLRRETCTPS